MHARFRIARVRPSAGVAPVLASLLASACVCASVPAMASPPPPPLSPSIADATRVAARAVDDIIGATTRVRRTRTAAGFPLPALIDGPWRFDFELTLGRDGSDLMLVDGTGTARRFVPHAALVDGRFVHVPPDGSADRILGRGVRHTHHAIDGTVTTFETGRPVTAASPDGSVARWRHEGGRPTHHDDGRGRVLSMVYENGSLKRIDTPDATLGLDTVLEAARRIGALDPAPPGGAWFGDCPADTTCDTDATPAPPGFRSGPGIPGAIRRDLRPGSCRSHFVEHGSIRRGQAIEHGLGRLPGTRLGMPTVRAFPVVDFVGRRELVVVRSRDLTGPSYADPARDGLFDRLMRDGRDIDRLLLVPLRDAGHVAVRAPAGESGIRRIDARPARDVVLELIVRHGMASPGQVRQIARARALLATRHGIVLRVVEIP